MKKNINHPPKGSSVRVSPIKDPTRIRAIKELLQDQPRNLCLFTLGVNTNLKITSLLKVTAGMVRGLKAGDALKVVGGNEKGASVAILNKIAVQVIGKLLATKDFDDSEGLFLGERGVLTVPSVNRLIKQWCRAVDLKGNYGSHSLRKTFGYQQRVRFGVDLPVLMRVFRHSTKKETLNYLSIKKEKIRSLFENEI